MQMAHSNSYSASFPSTSRPLHSRHHLSFSHRSLGTARMSGSPYTAPTQLRSNSTPGSDSGRIISATHSLSPYSTHSQPSQPSLGCSPYPSEVSSTSAESPLSASSINESPFPEPLIDTMDYDASPHIVGENGDWSYQLPSEDIATASYSLNGPCSYPLPSYEADSADLYKQPVSGLLPMNVSLAMKYWWSPSAKRFQPLFPQPQQVHRQDNYYSNPLDSVPSQQSGTLRTSVTAQSFAPDFENTDLYPPLASSPLQSNITTHAPQPPPVALVDYLPTQQQISVKQESDSSFSSLYDRVGNAVSSSNSMAVLVAPYESASPPTDSTALPPAQYTQSPVAQSGMAAMPMLSAPVPRHSIYYGASLVSSCERTCQEQEQREQERLALRVQTHDLREQRTVRPTEVSPVSVFAGLPNAENDTDGEPDVQPFNPHESEFTGGRSTGQLHSGGAEGVLGYAEHLGSATTPSNGVLTDDEDAEAMEDYSVYDGLDEYEVDPMEELDEDDGDGEFLPQRRNTSKGTRLRSRSVAGRNSVRYQPYGVNGATKRTSKSPLISASDLTPEISAGQAAKLRKNARTLPIPVPVPNLTKKSRGRRVPTVQTITTTSRGQRDAALSARIYLCDVSGCGKCFARGEHLKRHIRSIHTHEKPHRCPYPGCGKEFSRHDNLGQHMKVHKDYPKILERMNAAEI